MTESKIQSDFHIWLWNNYPETHGAAYHIPNGGSRGKVEAFKFKSMGVVAGVPDYHIAIPRGEYASLYIEFKSPGMTARIGQLKVHETLIGFKNMVVVCDTLEDAKKMFLQYYAL